METTMRTHPDPTTPQRWCGRRHRCWPSACWRAARAATRRPRATARRRWGPRRGRRRARRRPPSTTRRRSRSTRPSSRSSRTSAATRAPSTGSSARRATPRSSRSSRRAASRPTASSARRPSRRSPSAVSKKETVCKAPTSSDHDQARHHLDHRGRRRRPVHRHRARHGDAPGHDDQQLRLLGRLRGRHQHRCGRLADALHPRVGERRLERHEPVAVRHRQRRPAADHPRDRLPEAALIDRSQPASALNEPRSRARRARLLRVVGCRLTGDEPRHGEGEAVGRDVGEWRARAGCVIAAAASRR